LAGEAGWHVLESARLVSERLANDVGFGKAVTGLSYRPVWDTAWLTGAGVLSYVLGDAVFGNRRVAREIFAEVRPDPKDRKVDGVELPTYCFVRGDILKNSPDEAKTIRDGSYFDDRRTMSRAVTVAILGGFMAAGVNSGANVMNGQDDAFVYDAIMMSLGTLAWAVGVSALARDGKTRLKVKQAVGSLMSIFAGRRLGYWAGFALFGGTMNTGLAITEEVFQGNRIDYDYGRTVVEQAYFGAGWINRGFYATESAIGMPVPSTYGYMIPGWILYRYPLMGQVRTAQTATNEVTVLVQDYAVAGSDERDAVRQEIVEWRTLLADNVAHRGYGNDETYRRAQKELGKVDWLIANLTDIPVGESDSKNVVTPGR
jgi:hypothetical protein